MEGTSTGIYLAALVHCGRLRQGRAGTATGISRRVGWRAEARRSRPVSQLWEAAAIGRERALGVSLTVQ